MRFRAICALVVAAAWLMLLGLFGPTSASAAPYPPPPCPTLSVSTTTPLPGANLTVTGTAFAPHKQIRLELRSKTHVLGTVTSDGSGAFSTRVHLPAGLSGQHELVAVGGDVAGAVGCPADPIQVLAIQTGEPAGGPGNGTTNGGGGGGTAFTGVDIALLLAVASALLASGVLLNRRGHARRNLAHSGR